MIEDLSRSPDRQITRSPDHQITRSPDHQITKSSDLRWLYLADFNGPELEVRAVLAQLNDLVIVVRFENKEPADDFARLGVGTIDDRGSTNFSAHDAAIAV